MVARVHCIAPIGYDGALIEVESDVKRGLPSLQVVGMGNKAIDEARERVRSAIANSLLEFPAQKITINLAPAELPKDGSHYDVAIALSILCVSKQLQQAEVNDTIFVGELALNGDIRPVKGIIGIVETAKKSGFSKCYVPLGNISQAQLIEDIEIVPVTNLKELYLTLKKEIPTPEIQPTQTASSKKRTNKYPLDAIIGQDQAKRALIIAAAGHHNILLNGPPGSGKTLLAHTLSELLPGLSIDEQIAVTKLHSLSGETTEDIITDRPFRSPHHTASRTSLIGGGAKPKPGEISLAHHGVLFLDEILEYPRTFLEALRQPLEDKHISISRAGGYATYPADFMLVGTMNPCPCGYYGDSERECSCSNTVIAAYQKKLSGPLLDRIDLSLNVPRVTHDAFLTKSDMSEKQHKSAQEQLKKAYDYQYYRYKSSNKYNTNLTSNEIKRLAHLDPDAETLLNTAAKKLSLSARSYFKSIKVARTIADLEQSAAIQKQHIAEALQYRQITLNP